MAIVTMKKLSLLGMQSDKDGIFDSLVRTQSVELKRSADVEACFRVDVTSAREKYAEEIARAEDCITYATLCAEEYNSLCKKDKNERVDVSKSTLARPRYEINYDYFLGFDSQTENIRRQLDDLVEVRRQINANEAEINQKRAELSRLALIAKLPHATTWYKDTETAAVRLMQINESELGNLNALAQQSELVDAQTLDTVNGAALVAVAVHKSDAEFFKRAAAIGLINCAVNCDVLPKIAIEDANERIRLLTDENAKLLKQAAHFAQNLNEWKVYVDYLSLLDEKSRADGNLLSTASTFVLEAYYPADSEEKILQAINDVTNNYVSVCDDVGEGEFAPTLLKNNGVVKRFEGVTNMYSPPAYREIDPNPVMSVFYFVIFGFMVADVGYGLLLLLAGIAATFVIKQQTGVKTMLQMFGICGLSAVVVGLLFGSCFCFQLYKGVVPSPDKYPMVMMIVSLMLGIVHISAGIGCKMAVKIKHKRYLSAWLSDFPWIITFAGLILAIFNAAMDMAAYEPWANVRLPEIVSNVALYVCLISLAVAVICAGLESKGFLGKVKSSFGSVYGIINYFSDVMSYIRVFGLMLSSALVGSVVNDISKMLMDGGGAGYVFAAIVLVVAHVFNLAMGVLSVYIHNGRLQYVEFFGKFYEGEGELFAPFGGSAKYTLIKED